MTAGSSAIQDAACFAARPVPATRFGGVALLAILFGGETRVFGISNRSSKLLAQTGKKMDSSVQDLEEERCLTYFLFEEWI